MQQKFPVKALCVNSVDHTSSQSLEICEILRVFFGRSTVRLFSTTIVPDRALQEGPLVRTNILSIQ